MKKSLNICLIMPQEGGRNWVGGTEYINNIIIALASLPSEVQKNFEISLICSQSLEENFYEHVYPYLKDIYYEEVDLEPLNPQNRVRWKLLENLFKRPSPYRFNAFLKKKNFDFVYPFFAKNGGKTSYHSCAWIPDFQHKYLTHFFTKEQIKNRDAALELTACNAPSVVLSSKTSELDFQTFFPESAHKSKILSFKILPLENWFTADACQTQQEYYLPDRFFLISNQFWQHKNHLVVFKALSILREKSIYPNIVCTGYIHDNRQPNYSDTILQTIHKSGISQQVYLLGLIPKLDQIQLMRRSLAVIQPSLFEGWSTVVETARTLGKPMLLSDLPIHLEQNPPYSDFFDRNSPENLAHLIAERWEHLSPGPDLGRESIAKENSLNEVQAFGYQFLKIAKGNP